VPEEDFEVVDVRKHFERPTTQKDIKMLFGGCDDQVLALDDMHFARLKEVGSYEEMAHILRLRPSIQSIVDQAKQQVTNELRTSKYGCYHMRQGDFREICAQLAAPEPTSFWAKPLLKEFKCHVNIDDLSIELQKNERPALILTDNPLALQDVVDNSPMKAITSQWAAIATEKAALNTGTDLSVLSLIMDQELCATADVAVLNKFSTVSLRIGSMRQEAGRSSCGKIQGLYCMYLLAIIPTGYGSYYEL
jgi:hypothetical protein